MRRGVGLLELLLVLVLTGVVLGSALAILGNLLRGMSLGLERWDRLEAVRTVWVTLEQELRPGRPGIDWRVDPEGTLHIRAFRGFARVCGEPDAIGTVPVAWRGERLPVADRDSVLVLDETGRWNLAHLSRWREAEAGCLLNGSERQGWMTWHPAPSAGVVLVRIFEAGSYSVTDGALRYSRGGGGRQPLTPELFASSSGFEAIPGGVLVRLEPRPHPALGGGLGRSRPSEGEGEDDVPGTVHFTVQVGEGAW